MQETESDCHGWEFSENRSLYLYRAEQDVNSSGRNLVGELILKKNHGLVGRSIAEEGVGWRSRERWSTAYCTSGSFVSHFWRRRGFHCAPRSTEVHGGKVGYPELGDGVTMTYMALAFILYRPNERRIICIHPAVPTHVMYIHRVK